MSGATLGWYATRLRRMSPGEVSRRALDQARRRAWARRQVRPGEDPAPPADLLEDRTFAVTLPEGVREGIDPRTAAAVVAAADRVLAGTWTVFGVPRPDSADPDWFLDPVTGLRAPDQRLAFALDHRDESATGNVKQIWELSRHHHLTVLAAAWWLTGEDRYAETVADQLRSWWRADPFLSGIHWTNGIEVGVRLLSWVWIRRLLSEWPKVDDLFENDPDALRQIAWHQDYLAAFPSHHSSANNHVVAEAAGLLAGACAFPWYARSAQWRAGAAALLERELDHNTFASGVNRELATDYHRFVLELGLVAAVEADAAGAPLGDPTWALLTRMLDAAAAVLDVTGAPPRQGDGDEGRALVVDDPDLDPWAVVLGAGRGLVGAPDWWPAPVPSLAAALLPAVGHRRPAADGLVERPAARPDRFDDAGLAILRTPPGERPEIWCRCDGGPHGFLSIAAHAHADALSVEVRHDGVEILADPGTYCYHGEPEWRTWFRSTAAHNTLEVAGVDSSSSGGPFLWVRHARTTVLECRAGGDGAQRWVAEHDGYRRLDAPAVHRREVSLDTDERLVTVTDTLDVDRSLPVRLAWHLGPDVDAELDGSTARLRWTTPGGARSAVLVLPGDLRWTAHRGEEETRLGWYSPGFGRRVPATSLIGTGTASAGARLVSLLIFA